jgi:UDP-N-acetylglucosamine--N-acetylmuramyl-(pentapeptide) pyrophosphoryl-undecaprenol N-acetylglucosamine transferase
VEHHLLPVQAFRRGVLLANLGTLVGLARSILAAGELFTRLRPGVVVVTGGYAGGPAGILAGLMGIPLALQEQNAFPGITTRVLSRWSRQIHLAFPEARAHLPSGARSRARVSGNPIRSPGRETQAEARVHFGLDPEAVVVLVTGGSQGASALNAAMLEAVRGVVEGREPLQDRLQLLWVTGPTHLTGIQEALAAVGHPEWVKVLGYTDEMPKALKAASLAVSRAGAMTTSELLAWGIPAILVPLPTSAEGHQRHNAVCLQDAGAALHLPEEELTGPGLWEALLGLLSEPGRLEAMKGAALERGRPQATAEIAQALSNLLPRGREVAS